MLIAVDSREKPRAIGKILLEFERQRVPYCVNKLWVGDYCNLHNPLVLIDRKQNIAEIAKNATVEHARFKRELERLDQLGGKMFILIEQDRIGDQPIKGIEDIMFWEPKFGEIYGERVFRVLASWKKKHNIDYVFCAKRNTGKVIIDLIGGDSG